MAGGASHGLSAFAATARSPNLRRAQLSFGAVFTAEWVLTVGLGILAFRDGGAAAVGLVAMGRLLPSALLAPAASVAVDRFRREHVLVAVCLVRAAAIGLAALAVGEMASPVAAYVLAAVATLAHTLYRPAHSALLPSLCTTPTELTSANVVRGLQDSLSALAGPLLAGVLVGPIGISGVFAVSAGLSVWAGWLIWRVHYDAPPRMAEAEQRRAPLREAVAGLAEIRRRPDILLLTVLGCTQCVIRGAFNVFVVVIALEVLGTGDGGVGVLTSGFGIGAVIGSLVVGMIVRATAFARWMAFSVALWGAPFAVMAAVTEQWEALALLAVVGSANAIVDVAFFTLTQLIVPNEVMGRVFASLESLFALTSAAGSLIAPGLIAAFGTRGALVATGLLGPVVALGAWRRVRGLDVRSSVSGRIIAILRRVEFLRPLPVTTIAQLANAATGREVAAGEMVVREGERGDDFYVIAEGWADVSIAGAQVRVLRAGDCFGEIAALKASPRTSSVRAGTLLRLLCLRGEQLVGAVTGYASSHSVATQLVEERLATRPGV